MRHRPVSIGVQAATMIDCAARVPLLVFAKRRRIDVKDPVDLALVRRGRLIHAAFDEVATRRGAGGTLGDERATAAELERVIAAALPGLDAGTAAAHASGLSAQVAAVAGSGPGTGIAHERRVSALLVPGVVVAGRVDTVIQGRDGLVVVERKTGTRRPWHARQVQLYADVILATWPGAHVASLELWYSGAEPGAVVVPHAPGDRLDALRGDAARGAALDGDGACRLVRGKCAGCPRSDCGVKRLWHALERVL